MAKSKPAVDPKTAASIRARTGPPKTMAIGTYEAVGRDGKILSSMFKARNRKEAAEKVRGLKDRYGMHVPYRIRGVS